MKTLSAALCTGALLITLAGVGWTIVRSPGAHTRSTRPVATAARTVLAGASDSMVLVLDRRLRATTDARLRERTASTGTMLLLLLDSMDVRVCEDLGRQLREMRQRAGSGLPLIVLADSAALGIVRAFARRERLNTASFVAIHPARVMAGDAYLPTPAVLIVQGRTVVVGVGHPRRFANIRLRSFADELSAYLPPPEGELPHP